MDSFLGITTVKLRRKFHSKASHNNEWKIKILFERKKCKYPMDARTVSKLTAQVD